MFTSAATVSCVLSSVLEDNDSSSAYASRVGAMDVQDIQSRGINTRGEGKSGDIGRENRKQRNPGAKPPQPYVCEGHLGKETGTIMCPGRQMKNQEKEIGGGDGQTSPPTRPRLYVGVHMYTVAHCGSSFPSEDLDVKARQETCAGVTDSSRR